MWLWPLTVRVSVWKSFVRLRPPMGMRSPGMQQVYGAGTRYLTDGRGNPLIGDGRDVGPAGCPGR